MLQVRSCSLDTWLPEQVEFMARTGNALGNAYWEAGLAEGQKPKSFATLQGKRGRVCGCVLSWGRGWQWARCRRPSHTFAMLEGKA